MLQPPSPVCKLIHPLSSRQLQLTETSRAVSSASKAVAESDRVAPKGYVKSVDMTLAVELPVSLTRNPLAILKVEHSKSISPFEISFTAAVHMILSFSNRETNVTQKSSY
jgi:hypothetical protein